jgi:hypothetical protein
MRRALPRCPSPMRILFVLIHYFLYVGGSEEVFRRLAEGLAGRGHRVIVVIAQLSGTPPLEKLGGVEIHCCRTPRFAYQFLFTLTSRSIGSC